MIFDLVIKSKNKIYTVKILKAPSLKLRFYFAIILLSNYFSILWTEPYYLLYTPETKLTTDLMLKVYDEIEIRFKLNCTASHNAERQTILKDIVYDKFSK